MGRRSLDAEATGPRLAEQFVEVREAFADRLGNQIDGRLIGFPPLRANRNYGIETGSGRSDYALRPRIEAAPRRLAGELDRKKIILIARRAVPMRLEQAQRSLQAGDTRSKLARCNGSLGGSLDREDLKHRRQHRRGWSRNC